MNNNNNSDEFKTSTLPNLNSPPPQISPALPLPAASAAAEWCGKAEMLPFLSLCSRYSTGPWAGLLQQTIKEKQKLGADK